MKRVVVHIDRLVLKGFRDEDRHAIGEGMRRSSSDCWPIREGGRLLRWAMCRAWKPGGSRTERPNRSGSAEIARVASLRGCRDEHGRSLANVAAKHSRRAARHAGCSNASARAVEELPVSPANAKSATKKKVADQAIRGQRPAENRRRIASPIRCWQRRHIPPSAAHHRASSASRDNRTGRWIRRPPASTAPSPAPAGRWSRRYGRTWSSASATTFRGCGCIPARSPSNRRAT